MSAHDELVALCREMHAAGEMVTYETLLARRGRGSRRDAASAMQAWREEAPVEAPRARRGRPSLGEQELREEVKRLKEANADLKDENWSLNGEIKVLNEMVRRYQKAAGEPARQG